MRVCLSAVRPISSAVVSKWFAGWLHRGVPACLIALAHTVGVGRHAHRPQCSEINHAGTRFGDVGC
jgi:hypothetical protein